MLLSILKNGNAKLRTKCKPIDKITPEIVKLAEDMIETMIGANGVGLAASQVGSLFRIFVFRDEVTGPDGEFAFSPPEVVINPVLSHPSAEMQIGSEGCLSIPGFHVDVVRPLKIHVRYQNLSGEFVEEDLEAFRARVFMHENDHLNGTLLIDRITADLRKKIDPILRKIKDEQKN